jgi:hypothetical protein
MRKWVVGVEGGEMLSDKVCRMWLHICWAVSTQVTTTGWCSRGVGGAGAREER